MSQIEELQSRITAAMERIGTGLTALAQQPAAQDGGGSGDEAELAAALEEEKLANAQLEERLKAIKARHADEMSALREELDASEELDGLKAELAALKAELEAAGEADDLRGEVESLKAQLADSSAEDALRAEIGDLTRKLADTGEVDALKSEIESLRAELADTGDTDALRAELDQQTAVAGQLKAALDGQSGAAARLDMDVQRLRQANDQLRDVNTALRDANEQAVGEPHLINKAMLAELEGLRAARAADVAEAGAVLARLEPLLAQAANLPEGEED